MNLEGVVGYVATLPGPFLCLRAALGMGAVIAIAAIVSPISASKCYKRYPTVCDVGFILSILVQPLLALLYFGIAWGAGMSPSPTRLFQPLFKWASTFWTIPLQYALWWFVAFIASGMLSKDPADASVKKSIFASLTVTPTVWFLLWMVG